jgi:hypothetical protein
VQYRLPVKSELTNQSTKKYPLPWNISRKISNAVFNS